MKENESNEKKLTWDEVMAHGESRKGPVTDEEFLEGWRRMMNMDMSTIPDEVDMDDEDWRREKAEAKAAAKLRQENGGQ